MNKATNEKIPFRLIECPECKHQLCWINPRLPNHCSECGKHIFMKLREGNGILMECTAWLRVS